MTVTTDHPAASPVAGPAGPASPAGPAAFADRGHLEQVQVHFDDLDALGVVHNGRYALMLERALSAFWAERGWTLDPASPEFADSFFVVREFTVTYHAPITRPGTVAVRLWVDHLGRSSVVYGFTIASSDGGVLHAEGRRVQVKVDPATLRPTPIVGRARDIATELLLPA